MTRNLPIILIMLVTLIIGALSFVNGTMVSMSLFGAALQVPEGFLLGGGYVLGMILSLPVVMARLASQKASHKQLSQWQTQDNKLAGQVQSDKEKQLEAKIATLEAALQRALKK